MKMKFTFSNTEIMSEKLFEVVSMKSLHLIVQVLVYADVWL